MRSIRDLLAFVLAPLALAWGVFSVDVPRSLPVEPYADGVTPLYLDRPYVNAAPNAALAGQQVVRVPRHLRFDVELELSAPARALRLLSDENDNSVFAGWERVDAVHVEVPGRSCELTRAVALTLPAGLHRLPAGGPVAAAPLLVASGSQVRARTTSAWNKLTPGAGPVDFVMGNKTKLAGFALGWAAWCFALLRWRARAGGGSRTEASLLSGGGP